MVVIVGGRPLGPRYSGPVSHEDGLADCGAPLDNFHERSHENELIAGAPRLLWRGWRVASDRMECFHAAL